MTRIAAGSYTDSKARSMKDWAGKNKDKIRANKRRWRERQKLKKRNKWEEMNSVEKDYYIGIIPE